MSYLKNKSNKHSEPIQEKSEENKKPNKQILLHEKKRAIELKCYLLQEELTARETMSLEEITSAVDLVRKECLDFLLEDNDLLENKHIQVYQTHQAMIKREEKNKIVADAFGINKETFVFGAAFDHELQVFY